MKLDKADKSGPCEVIVGEFAWFSQRCGQLARFVTEDDGETFYICDEHIAATRQAAS